MLSKLTPSNSDNYAQNVSTTNAPDYFRKPLEKRPMISFVDDFLIDQLGSMDDTYLLINNRDNIRLDLDRKLPVCSSDTNFFDEKRFSVNERFSKKERICYYEMLIRDRIKKKTRKNIRKAAKKLAQASIGLEADGDSGFVPAKVQDALDNLKDFITEFLQSDLKDFFLSENDVNVADYKSIEGIIGDDFSAPMYAQLALAKGKMGIDFKWILHLMTTFLLLLESTSTYMDALIVANYCSVVSISGKNATISAILLPLMVSIRAMFSLLKSRKEGIKVESLSEMLYAGRSSTADFISSHLMMSIREIVLILASYHLFPKEIARHLTLWLGKIDKPKSLPEATSKIVTDVANIVHMGEALLQGVPLNDIFRKADPVMSAKKVMSDLLYEYNTLYFGLPTEHGFEAKGWVVRARSVIESIRNIQKRANPYDQRISILEKEMRTLTEKLVEVTSKVFRSKRVPPYLIVIASPPGVGKSSLVTLVCQIWSKLKKRIFDQTHVFERVVSSQYWDGYDPWSNPIIHYSEIGSLLGKLAESGQDKAVLELLSVCDSLPYSLDMSAVTDKGRFFCMPELVVIDTNNIDMNLTHVVRNVAAFRRRGIYLIPTVKPEFLKPGSCMLDANKVGENILDKWTFQLYRTDPINNTKSKQIDLMIGSVDDDIFKLTEVLAADMKSFMERESTVQESLAENWVEKYFPNGFGIPNDDLVELPDLYAGLDDLKYDYSSDEESEEPLIPTPWSGSAHLEADSSVRVAISKKSILANALGNAPQYIELQPLCECCPLGIHQTSTREKFDKFSQDLKRKLSLFIRALAHLYLMASFSLASYMDTGFDLSAFFLVMFFLLSTIYIPYLWINNVIMLLLALFKYLSDNLDSYMNRAVHRVVLQPAISKLNDSFNDAKEYIVRKQRYIIGASVVVSVLFTLSKLYSMYFRKSKYHVESTFLSSGEVYDRAVKKEKFYGMSMPESRIKKKLPQKTYDNVMTRDPPLYTGKDLTMFTTTVQRNLRPVKCETHYSTGVVVTRKGMVFGVRGSYALILGHFFDLEKSTSVKVTIAPHSIKDDDGNYQYMTEMFITKKDVFHVASDVYLMKFDGVQFSDRTRNFSSGIFPNSGSKVMIDGHATFAYDFIDIDSEDGVFTRKVKHSNVVTYEWPYHGDGKCGTPLLMSSNGGCFILGVHVAGDLNNGPSGYAVKLNGDVIDHAISELSADKFLIYSKTEAGTFICDDPEVRSFTRYVDQGPTEIHGKIHVFNGNQKSNIVPSMFADDSSTVDVLFSNLPPHEHQIFKPAILGPTKKGSPLTGAAIKLCSKKLPINREVLDICVDVLSARIISNLENLDVSRTLHPCDFMSVINGVDGDPFARNIDMSKSGGFGYPGAKKKYMYFYPCDSGTGGSYEPVSTLMEDVLSIIDSYESYQSSNPVFKAFMKDEVRPIEKVQAMKTRMVYATPLPYLIVQKAILGPLYSLMIEHSEAFYCGLGTDMHREGVAIKQRMVDFFDNHSSSHNWGEGDYGEFDVKMPYEIGEASCIVEKKLLKWLGYSDTVMQLVDGIMSDTLFPRVDFFGDLLTVAGLQTSGRYGTAENNCFRNLLLLMYAWYNNSDLSHLDFFDYVLPCVYGDDVLNAVLDPVKDVYNNITVAKSCSEIGLQYTSSSKLEVEQPFVDESDISFLKRTFRFHPRLGKEVAPLSLQSIDKMLMWIEPSKNGEMHVQYDGIIRSALYEIFFWTEEREYENIRSHLRNKFLQAYPEATFNLPAYVSLLETFA